MHFSLLLSLGLLVFTRLVLGFFHMLCRTGVVHIYRLFSTATSKTKTDLSSKLTDFSILLAQDHSYRHDPAQPRASIVLTCGGKNGRTLGGNPTTTTFIAVTGWLQDGDVEIIPGSRVHVEDTQQTYNPRCLAEFPRRISVCVCPFFLCQSHT